MLRDLAKTPNSKQHAIRKKFYRNQFFFVYICFQLSALFNLE